MGSSKIELLIKMAQLGHDRVALLFAAEDHKRKGDLESSIISYKELVDVDREYLRVALEHNRLHENPVDIEPIVQPQINALLTLADLQQATGELELAEEERENASALARQHLDSAGQAEIERSRAASLITQARFNEALVSLAAARDLFRLEGDTIQLARTILDLADILQWLGDYSRAFIEIRHAEEIVAPLVSGGAPTQQDILQSLMNTAKAVMSGGDVGSQALDTTQLYRISTEITYYEGLIEKARGNYDSAEQSFHKVLPEYASMGVKPAIEYQLASIQVAKGNHQDGLAYARRLEPSFTKGDLLRPKLAALLRVQAEALLHLDETEEALQKVRQGIDDLLVYHDPDLLWRLQWLEGRIHEAMASPDKALRAYSRAAQTVDGLRRAPLGFRLDSTYLQDKLDLFDSAIILAARQGLATECNRFIEMIKSRTLAAVLGVSSYADSKSDGELENNFDRITRELDAIEYEGYRQSLTDDLLEKKDVLLAQRAKLLEQLRFANPQWRTLTEPVPLNLEDVAENLAEHNKAALNLYYKPNRIVAVLMMNGESYVDEMEVTDEINVNLEKYILNLVADKRDRVLYDPANAGLGARHFIPQELLDQALETDALLIVPHGPLHLVPWAGMLYQGKRLFQYCPVGILPNLSCLQALTAKPTDQPNIALIGAPDYSDLPLLSALPHAKNQITDIEKLYAKGGQVIQPVLIGNDATESGFWQLAKEEDVQDGILHIVCHGTVEVNDPMNSGLLMVDSKIDAAEIARSCMKYREIILGACSCGWRPQKVQDIKLSGDDILGLPGAFLEAGVQSVLVSIPPADDIATYRFMVLYHQNRLEGKPPLVAHQSTQKAMEKDAEYDASTWISAN